MKNSNTLIEIKQMNYKNIFQNFNLTIEKGKITAISGTNSSGKSTLIKLISTMISIDNCIFLENTPIEKINKNKLFLEMGTVILEDSNTFICSSVEEELFNILENIKLDQKEKINQYQKIIKLLKMEDILIEDPNKLNRNSKIKILLAAALLSKPKILLLDDICSMMTKIETIQLLNIIKELNKKEKITVVMTTDDLSEVVAADYLYILEKGKIILDGSPLEVLKKDNIINRLGLSLPFMIDLSVKLNDYELLDGIMLDMDRMINKLWK